ncbi:Gfo/Idh/MocA family oxidoreductase [Sphingomonas lutea]|uniref:Gfo/Idh/MocA family oxidoreductase n=1 Tax=Sphingomonas lutea TaxID=1045317 RepID=A0A7G9SIV0_9SPHN|nr:Gfo/Idh/MocA family oxidoreductase [Sphingomonas lutea]QNN67775.1 Gfo/Idh/MocA family oxidoreductase [Sphingomonas lutea]
MTPIRTAILGFGKIAADQHVPAITANPRFDLVASSSRSGQGVGQTFTDWRKLIREVDGLEAVAITTPPGPRYEIARECVLAGLHCLLEKPPTATLTEIADLACLAEAQRVSLFATWHAQHHRTVDAAARALAGKRIARLDIRWHEDVDKWHPGQDWIWQPGGFGVFDPGINAFSILTRIFPGSLFVRSAELHVPHGAQTPIAADIAFSSPQADGPLRCSLDWRRTEGEEWTIAVDTSDGTRVRLENGGARLAIDGQASNDEGPGEYPDIYRTFLDLIDARDSSIDVAPLRLVADCLLLGTRREADPIKR